jgi:benzoate membrane transport protein
VPIVMAMVAGVFLRFGLGLVFAVRDDFWIATPMIAAFLVLGALPVLRVPPMIGALVVGAVVVSVLGRFAGIAPETAQLVHPNLYIPEFSWQAMAELVVPLAITVLVVQNGQGVTVLRAAGHEPPVNAVTVACGVWSIAAAAVGAASTCLTGPVNALLAASGEKSKQYSGGLVVGALAVAFGLFAPLFTNLMLATPKAFIAALAGLAMLRVLQSAFVISFKERFTLGALVTFLVTVGDVPILNIGAPSWGLVFGIVASLVLERGDFRAAKKA